MLTLQGQRPVQVLASFLNTSFTEEQATTKRVRKIPSGFSGVRTRSGGNFYEKPHFRQESRSVHGAVWPAAELRWTAVRLRIILVREGCPPSGALFLITQCQEVWIMQKHLFVKTLVRSMEQYGQLLNCVGQL